MKILFTAILAFTLASACPGLAATEEFVEIASRPGVSVPALVTSPDGPPFAAAILFAGGSGKIKLHRDRPPKSNNFLVRSRSQFAERGVMAVTVDVPSDRRREGLKGFRGSDEHRADIAAVLRWIRIRTSVPVWLIGTSRGTVSLGHLAGKLPITGAVFSATVTKASRRNPPTALDGELEIIKVPVLLVHHRDDDCIVTPASGLPELTRRLTQAAKVETRLFEGGKPAESKACRAKSPHGFFGIEAKVVDSIVQWMRTNKAL